VSESLSCRQVDELLARFESGDLAEPDVEVLAAHLETCLSCGALQTREAADLDRALRTLGEPSPDDAFFRARHAEIMEAVRGESRARPALRRAGRASRTERRAGARRVALAAMAAGVALVIGVLLVRRDGTGVRVPHDQVVSVDEIDAAELADSEDAWLVARDDSFEPPFADAPALEDLSDEELEALEALVGSGRG